MRGHRREFCRCRPVGKKRQPGESVSMWDMSRFIMITLLSLHSDKILYFGAYKLLVTHVSRDLG